MASKQRKRSVMLSDQWMDFADKTYDADEYAEGFFLTHPESEAEDRCSELMVRGGWIYRLYEWFCMVLGAVTCI